MNSNSTHNLDEKLARLIFDECWRQLSLDEVPLKTGGDRPRLNEKLAGLIGPSGHDPEAVLSLFLQNIAPAILACDTPRFMAFVSCVPAKGIGSFRCAGHLFYAARYLLARGGGAGRGREPGSAGAGRCCRDARHRRWLFRVRRFGR